MKKILKITVILLVLTVFFSCDKNDGFRIEPITPLFDYSSVAFIARITHNSSDWSLCVMDKSGNGMQKIVDKTVACQKPVRSNSGTQLLFTAVKFESWTNPDNSFGSSSEYELYIINTDGTGLTLIDRIDKTEKGGFGNFDWSPDDKQIIYVKYTYYSPGRENDLILYNISNKTHKILQTEGDICSPKFSPDGRWIAYCSSAGNDHHIYRMNVNGANNRLIIRNAASPKWSPQGDKIAYSASGEERSSQIFVANADGRNQKQLTFTVSPRIWPGWPPDGNGSPQWTPDGKKIVYVSHENEKSEIFIMNADGSAQTRLTKAEYNDNSPEITPDGKYILFSSNVIGIQIMTLDGKNQNVLSNVGTSQAYPIACR
ncbi:MAG: hypothetical protein FWE63_01295 [Bacteroidales bacterium]|nr:hypothetical protein [Bacteroidales bacterium]